MARTNDTKCLTVDTQDSHVIIPAGQQVSSSFNAEACSLLGVYLPTNLVAGNMTIQVSKYQHIEPDYYVTVDGALYSIPVTGGLFWPIPVYLTVACQRFRFVISTVQTEDVKLDLSLGPIFSAN